jgi:hypothetical protein
LRIELNLPASHRSDHLDLPDVPVSIVDPLGKTPPTRSTIGRALKDWFSNDDSNLLLIMGDFGTGKTTAIGNFTASSGVVADNFNFEQIRGVDRNLRGIPTNKTVIFDNFDAVNSLVQNQHLEPDLREVSYLASKHRLVLATRRTPQARADELLGQLTSEQRLVKLGFNKPRIVHILSWELSDLQEHAARLNPADPYLEIVLSYLASDTSTDVNRFRRPLLMKMLYSIARRFGNLNAHLTVANLYHEYCLVAVAADYDANRSQIAAAMKTDILADLAYDIFSGKAQIDRGPSPPLSVPLERVSERIFEVLMRKNVSRPGPGFDSYNWTGDFLSHNHIFEEIPTSWPPSIISEPQFGFVQESFYEYFVSIALCRKIIAGQTLGLEIDRFSPATVDSLAFAFAKELGGARLRDAIRNTVLRPRLSVADRLVLLYFLEDEQDFASILARTPAEYLGELAQLEKSVPSFFLKKMIRYQLVVSGSFDAVEYVAELRKNEDEGGLKAEVRLHSAETAATQQLLLRLQSSALFRARPITIYRLGQLGDASAIEPLEQLSASETEPVRAAVVEALSQIRSRIGKLQ